MSEQTNRAAEREALFIRLYRAAFPQVARYVRRMGGSAEEAKDVFQDALLAYYEKSIDEPFAPGSSEKAYVAGIARHLWLKRYRDDYATRSDIDVTDTAADAGGGISSSRIISFLETAGRRCMELLQAVYYEKLPMKDVAQQFGFSGERSATVQKFKCLEKVRQQVKQKALSYEDFHE